jgi:hypothetical protein
LLVGGRLIQKRGKLTMNIVIRRCKRDVRNDQIVIRCTKNDVCCTKRVVYSVERDFFSTEIVIDR